MTRIRLHLKALSPLAFGARRGTTSVFVDTLDYVPGTSLRGSVAARYLQEIGEAGDERFRKIFLEGGALFANLYPKGQDGISCVIPATARSCKARDGFLSDSDPERDEIKHGVSDTLMRAAAFRMFEDHTLLDEIAECPQCHQATDRFSGFYEKLSGESPAYHRLNVHKRHLTHVGINRRTQTAEHGFLYARQVINESKRKGDDRDFRNESKRKGDDRDFRAQMFDGDLIVSDEIADFVMGELLAEGTTLRIGESRTRGLGRVQVVSCKTVDNDTEEAVRTRITKFNEEFSRQTRRSRERDYISVTLQSDAVLTDAFMRPKSTIEADDIRRALSRDQDASAIAPDALRLVYANAGTRLVQSWNVASGYPKPDDIAITMGSIFLFELLGGAAEELAGPMSKLQECGIGKRRSEGFGRLTVCDEFHWEVQELWQAI